MICSKQWGCAKTLKPFISEMSIPRFPIATGFDDLDSLGEKLRTRHLPVQVIQPASPVLQPEPSRPSLELTIAPGDFDLTQIACYVSGQQRAEIVWQGPRTLSIRSLQPLPPGRTKYTCTAPSRAQSGVYYWYSYVWLQPKVDGSWYAG